MSSFSFPRRAPAWPGAAVVDTEVPDGPERSLAIADRCRLDGARLASFSPKARRPGGLKRRTAHRRRRSTRSPSAVGLAADWWDIGGKRTIVSPDSKIALLGALGLAAASEAEARDSLTTVLDETRRRRIPPSLVLRPDEKPAAPLRDAPGACDARIEREDGRVVEWRTPAGDGVCRALPDGRTVAERTIALPESADRPPSPHRRRRRMRADRRAARVPTACRARRRKRFGVTAQIYALRRARRSGDRRLRRRWPRPARRPATPARPISASARCTCCFPRDRGRASPYYPSDRRFLDPILIDVFDADLPRDAAASSGAGGARAGGRRRLVGPPRRLPGGLADQARRRSKRCTARSPAPSPRGPAQPLVADYQRLRRQGRRGAAAVRGLPGDRGGRGRRELARRGRRRFATAEPKAVAAAIEKDPKAFDFALFCQWLADRQLARAAERARRRGLGIGFYRDLAVGSAPDGAEAWAQRRRADPRRDGRRAARSVLDQGAELGSAGAEPARGRAARAGRRSATSTPRTCGTPECCASTTPWACSACF